MKILNKVLVLTLAVSMSVLVSACGGGSSGSSNLSIPGVSGPKVQLLEDNILIDMVFQNIQVEGGVRYNIPKYERSYLELSPDLQSDGTLMSVSISLQDVFHGGVNQLPSMTLPGGRALPGVSGGKLPAVAFTIPQFKDITIYLGNSVFGIFVPAKVDMSGAIVTARFYIQNKRAGVLALVSNDTNGENGGLLLMLDLTSSTKKQLSKIARKYE